MKAAQWQLADRRQMAGFYCGGLWGASTADDMSWAQGQAQRARSGADDHKRLHGGLSDGEEVSTVASDEDLRTLQPIADSFDDAVLSCRLKPVVKNVEALLVQMRHPQNVRIFHDREQLSANLEWHGHEHRGDDHPAITMVYQGISRACGNVPYAYQCNSDGSSSCWQVCLSADTSVEFGVMALSRSISGIVGPLCQMMRDGATISVRFFMATTPSKICPDFATHWRCPRLSSGQRCGFPHPIEHRADVKVCTQEEWVADSYSQTHVVAAGHQQTRFAEHASVEKVSRRAGRQHGEA
mmetsp:Transcript_8228/g.17873  ORF Transcript_8228/g.17873 Transcript_8228/m.17873 type:complete len:297 (-) Transcript_8228:183-1073(-)|eukprot:CAMPEP_0204368708 /NCGR_PEP_ID=MMETSP0469-20131031/44396_1 /ASSEMBLY_ACC=CAM_ASM_000384 /TAXON_ID=2969 /ORGANISM="Oxyrrhis marina" /LENGTH=296 /DNA_ID=CAMNT_0051358311 /DNA_START=35 /DNA_END=925 /DNA_ORIENTATION=+